MAATFQDVEDGVKNIAQGVGAWSSLGLWGGQVRSQTAPLGIGEVGRIGLSHRRAYETILTLTFTKQALTGTSTPRGVSATASRR
jgi:hypothetical protein